MMLPSTGLPDSYYYYPVSSINKRNQELSTNIYRYVFRITHTEVVRPPRR
jgi:hypothetical protein